VQQHARMLTIAQRLLQFPPPPHEHLVRRYWDPLAFLDEELLVAMGRRHHLAPHSAADDRTAAVRPEP
jgi:hypothetical protein